MKLHLPKMLLTAVLAAVTLAPAAMALSITGAVAGSGYTLGDTELTNAKAYRNGQWITFSYDGAGTVSGVSFDDTTLTFTFNLDLDQAAKASNITKDDITDTNPDSSYIVYVSNGSSQWGLRLYDGAYTENSVSYTADGVPEIVGHWSGNNNMMYKQDVNAVTLSELGYSATGGSEQTAAVTATIADNKPSGVALYKGTGVVADNKVYHQDDLLTSTDEMTSIVFNKNYASSITLADIYSKVTVGNSAETWSHDFDISNTTFLEDADPNTNGVQKYAVLAGDDMLLDGDDANGQKIEKSIVVGSATQLFLQTWKNGGNPDALNVERDIYIGSSTYSGEDIVKNPDTVKYHNIALRFGNDTTAAGGNVTNIKGNIYIVEDAKMISNSTNVINFENAVTDVVDGVDTGSTLTINGKGYVFKSGVTLSGLKLESETEVTFTENSTLTIDGIINNAGTLVLNGTLNVSSVDNIAYTRYGLDANGYATIGKCYTVYTGTGTLSGNTQGTYGGKSFTITDGIRIDEGFYYVIAKDSVQVGGTNAPADTITAEKFYVNTGATMVLGAREQGAALSVDQVLATTHGTGTIDLRTTGTIADEGAPEFDGVLKVSKNGELQIGSSNYTGDVTGNWTADLSSLSGIELAGGKMRFRGGKITFTNVSVTAESTLDVWDVTNNGDKTQITGGVTINKLALNGKLNMTNSWKSKVTIEELSGSNDLNVQYGDHNYGDKEAINRIEVDIQASDAYSGTIYVAGKSDTESTIPLTTLTVGKKADMGTTFGSAGFAVEHAKLVLYGGTGSKTAAADAQSIGSMTLGSNATVEYADGSYNIKKLEVKQKTAAILSAKWDKNQFLGALVGDDSHLTLKRIAGGTADKAALYNLDGSGSTNYSGTIKLENNANDNQSGLVVRHSEAYTKLKDAAFELAGTNAAVLAFASNDFTVTHNQAFALPTADKLIDATIAGLKGDKGNVYAAALTINTAADKEYSFGGALNTSSLIKDGAGTQTLTGTVSSKDITVGAGELILSKEITVEKLAMTGGVLTVGTYTGEELTENTLTVTSSASFGAGAKVNANLVLSNNTQLTLDGALTMGSDLKLGTGIVLDDATLASINALTAGDSPVTLFEGVDSLVLGTATYSDEVAFSAHFAGVTNNDVYLGYDGQNVFAGIQSVPEPTTATLSLLALAGLAARRRRK